MPVVRSASITACSPAGSVRSSFGSCVLIWSTVEMTLAPGWRWTLRMIAGARSASAPSRAFSAPCVTVATSERRTGAAFW